MPLSSHIDSDGLLRSCEIAGNDTTHYNVDDFEYENLAGAAEFAATKKELGDLLIATVTKWQD